MEINRRTNHQCPNPRFSSPWTNWIQTNAKRYSDTVTPPRAWSIHTHTQVTNITKPSVHVFPLVGGTHAKCLSSLVWCMGLDSNWWVEPTKGIAQVQQRRPPSILLSCIPRKLSTKTVPPCKKIGWSHKKRTFVEYVENHVCGTRNRRPPTKAN